jgi:hypothetical protein
MFRRLAGCAFLVVGLFVLAAAADPSESALTSFCGACTDDDDCGTSYKCCTSNCSDGKKKCVRVDTCD